MNGNKTYCDVCLMYSVNLAIIEFKIFDTDLKHYIYDRCAKIVYEALYEKFNK
jgi:hypothetical protein